MKTLTFWMLLGVLTAPAAAPAASRDQPPDRELLKMMELLREIEMIKQMEILQDMQTIENAGELAKGGASPRSPSGKKKEIVK